jgi:TP901 family phage tail tape measure protein
MAKDRTLGLKLRAIDKMSRTIDKVQKKFPKLSRSIEKASKVNKIFNHQTKQMRASLKKIGGTLDSFGKKLTLGVTLPLLAAGGAGVKFFVDFEQGLKGVEKTTGIAGPAIEKLGQRFDQLSTEIPVSTAEMLELAQAGGQLGIKGAKNIEKFTTVMAKLSRASDVAGEDGAKSIARILTVTGDGIDKVDRFSAALVDLGNNAAAGEGEILEVANRVAGQIGRFDVASDKVLGISTALKALGKNSEAAGSVVGRSFDAIDQSIKAGGEQAKILSKLTGVAVKDLKSQFQDDAASVFQKFVGGLNKVQSGGGNMIKVMSAMGLQGVRINDILGTLAKNPEVLAENLDRATKAFSENNALQKEFDVQTSTLGSSLTMLNNTFTSLLTMIGKDLAPVVAFFAKIFKSVINTFRESPIIRRVAIVFGILAAVLGPLLVVLGGIVVAVPAVMGAFISLAPVLAVLGVTFGGLVLVISKFVLFAGILVSTGVAILANWKPIKAFFADIFTSPLDQLMDMVFWLSKITGLTKLLGFKKIDDTLNKKGFTIKDGENSSKGIQPFKRLGDGVTQRQKTEVGGVLDINIAGAPRGSNAKAKPQGPLDFNLGFAGGFQ